VPRYIILFSELEALLYADEQEGVCVNCGNLQGDCEPDACQVRCEECYKRTVYGAQEVLMREWYTTEE
jgi:hypothetical protein